MAFYELVQVAGLPKHWLDILFTAMLCVPPVLGIVLIFLKLQVLTIKRLHDFNFSAWWILLTGIPVVGGLWSFLIICMPTGKSKNRYGLPVPEEEKIFILPLLLLIGIIMILRFFKEISV